MLILTRKPEQSIIIGDDIAVTVLRLRGSQISLGITAPDHIAVHRREVYLKIQEAKGQIDNLAKWLDLQSLE